VKIPGRQNPSANIFELVRDWLRDERKGRWALILDNLDDADFLMSPSGGRETQVAKAEVESSESRPLLAYIPHCQHGSVLVTSRSKTATLKLVEEANIITIKPINVEDTVILFKKKFSRPRTHDAFELVTTLIALLEYMPLTIVQAAAFISQRWPRCSIQQYLTDYQASNRKKTGLLSYKGGELRRDVTAKNSILITWQISFDYIRQARPSAADILSFMSFCDRQGIPEILLRGLDAADQQGSQEAQIDSIDKGEGEGEVSESELRSKDSTDSQSNKSEINTFEDDILVLRNYSFIITNEDGSTFKMHRLVQLAILEWLKLHKEKAQWRHRFLTKVSHETV
jgi:hypothetical protein